MINFSKWMEAKEAKVLYIMRGVSGSGKSTLANSLADPSNIFSTDDFFGHGDEYVKNFNPSKLGEAHQWNQDRVIEAMSKGINPIVVDNTHTQAWEAKPYVKAALKNGYEVIIKEPNSPMWKVVLDTIEKDGDLDSVAEKLSSLNKHGVPKEAIEKMLQRYEPNITVDKILDSKSPFDK